MKNLEIFKKKYSSGVDVHICSTVKVGSGGS
jgi:hypothetical protein